MSKESLVSPRSPEQIVLAFRRRVERFVGQPSEYGGVNFWAGGRDHRRPPILSGYGLTRADYLWGVITHDLVQGHPAAFAFISKEDDPSHLYRAVDVRYGQSQWSARVTPRELEYQQAQKVLEWFEKLDRAEKTPDTPPLPDEVQLLSAKEYQSIDNQFAPLRAVLRLSGGVTF